jgi:twitching motility protein PilT
MRDAHRWNGSVMMEMMSKVKRLLSVLVEQKGSDLHLSCGVPPILRIHGALQTLPEPALTANDLDQVFREIISPDQRARFQVALDLDFVFDVSQLGRFRGNAFLQQRGTSVVFRLIPAEIPTAEELRLPEVVRSFSSLQNGLVLVTGPAGSGKSTTLAALIDLINRSRTDHIITIEDPIEFVHTNQRALVNQREVGVHTLTFASALRAALREDPDVILVGELRDPETIATALTAAETGHLVLGTLHTQSAHKAIDRMIDSFPTDQQEQSKSMLAESLRGVVAQQLLMRADGSGRVLASEVLLNSPAVANLIREGKTFQIPAIMQTGRKAGMWLMDQAITELLADGIVSRDEAMMHAQDRASVATRIAQ